MSRFRNHKHFVTFVCLILGAVLLTSAAVANIGNAGGYEAYKDGLLGLLSLEDYSGDLDLVVTVDGTEFVYLNYFEEVDTNAQPGEVHTHAGYSGQVNLPGSEPDTETVESWSIVNPLDHPSGRDYTQYEYNSYSSSPEWHLSSRNYTDSILSDFRIDTEDDYAAKVINVVEMAVDLVVGDLKNNFVYIGEEDGLAKYRVSLSGDQLPEIVQALLSLLTEDSLYMSDWGIETAIGFEPYAELTEEELEEYRNLRDEVLWNKMYDDETSKYYLNGHFVIFPDLSYQHYEDINDYFKTIDNIPLEDLLNDLDVAFLMMDKEPEIVVASCDLSIDENGNLVENTLSGTVEIELVNGQKHSITLTIDAKLDPLNGRKIDMPAIPADATVYDYSQGNKENGYIYTITKNGITTTHSETEENQQQAYTRFVQMHGFERILDAGGYVGAWFDIYNEYPVDLYGDGTSVECYEINLAANPYTGVVPSEEPDEVIDEIQAMYQDAVADMMIAYGRTAVPEDILRETAAKHELDIDTFYMTIQVMMMAGEIPDGVAYDGLPMLTEDYEPTDEPATEPEVDTEPAEEPITEPEVVINYGPQVEITEVAATQQKPVVVDTIYAYSDTGMVYIPVEQFEAACAEIFAAGEPIKNYAADMGLTPQEVVKILYYDYALITGEDFEGYVFWANN